MHRALTNKTFSGKKLGRYIYGALPRLLRGFCFGLIP
jgi:hypothetical protein